MPASFNTLYSPARALPKVPWEPPTISLNSCFSTREALSWPCSGWAAHGLGPLPRMVLLLFTPPGKFQPTLPGPSQMSLPLCSFPWHPQRPFQQAQHVLFHNLSPPCHSVLCVQGCPPTPPWAGVSQLQVILACSCSLESLESLPLTFPQVRTVKVRVL